MAAKSTAFANNLLKMIFNSVAIPGLGSALYVSLHSASPNAAGTQSSYEVTYSGYSRVPIERSTAGWTTAAANTTSLQQINFPQCTGGAANATHWAIGTQATGEGGLLYFGALQSALSISELVIPSMTTASISEF